MAASSLVKKLGIKPDYKLLILNAPDGYTLGTLPEGAVVESLPSGTFDLVQMFVRSKAEIAQQVPSVLKAVKKDGLLWITFPKKSGAIKTDLSRDTTWQAVNDVTGWQGVTLIAVDDTWSAMRFRPEESVKSKKKD